MPSGEIVSLGGRTLKNVVGYDLLHIFIGAEGTLGVITKAELKLNPLPPTKKTIIAVYDNVATAGEGVYRVLENGVIPDKIELIDNWVINMIEEMIPIGPPEGRRCRAPLRVRRHRGGRGEGDGADRGGDEEVRRKGCQGRSWVLST